MEKYGLLVAIDRCINGMERVSGHKIQTMEVSGILMLIVRDIHLLSTLMVMYTGITELDLKGLVFLKTNQRLPLAMKLLLEQKIVVTEDVRLKRGLEEHAKNGIHNLHINLTRRKSIQHLVPQGIITIAEILMERIVFGATRLTKKNDGNIVLQ